MYGLNEEWKMCNAFNSTFMACEATQDIGKLEDGGVILVGLMMPLDDDRIVHFKSPVSDIQVMSYTDGVSIVE